MLRSASVSAMFPDERRTEDFPFFNKKPPSSATSSFSPLSIVQEKLRFSWPSLPRRHIKLFPTCTIFRTFLNASTNTSCLLYISKLDDVEYLYKSTQYSSWWIGISCASLFLPLLVSSSHLLASSMYPSCNQSWMHYTTKYWCSNPFARCKEQPPTRAPRSCCCFVGIELLLLIQISEVDVRDVTHRSHRR